MNHALNATLIGWALNFIALGLCVRGGERVGVLLVVLSFGAAWLVESWRAYGCNHPRLYRAVEALPALATVAAYALWFVRGAL